MYQSDELQKKQPVLEHPDLPEIAMHIKEP